MAATQQYTTFRVERLLIGIEVERVQEVIRVEQLTPVPLAPPVVEGLINLRGQIVTAIDLRRRLELPQRPGGAEPMHVVLHSELGAVSLLVDAIGEVVEVSEEEFEAPPETLRTSARELIRGAYKLRDRLLLVLHLDAVLVLPPAA